MKKIGQVSRFYFPISGGQEIYINHLNQIFERNGLASFVIQPHLHNVSTPDNVICTKPIPFAYRLNKYIKNLSWFLFNFELNLLRKKLSGFDILISHYSFHLPSIKDHPKCIVVSHGVLWSEKEDNIFNNYLKNTDKSLSRRKENITIVANDTHYLETIGIKSALKIEPFSEIQRNVWYIPNCVDIQEFKPNAKVEREKIIFLPRNIRKDRGIHLAIKAFVIFLKDKPEYKLFIAGMPTNGEYFDECKKIITDNILDDKIIFLGFKSKDEIKILYQKSMLTLVPSLEKEGTSLSALESMASGTPVVATHVGGLKDLPCVLAAVNAEDIANKMIDVMSNWTKYSQTQLETVQKVFNIKNWEEAWLNVIKSKIQNGN